MKAGKSWSLRDVDEHTRTALLKAAEKSGLSVNDWLGAEKDEHAPKQPAPKVPTPGVSELRSEGGDPSSEIREAIARLTGRLAGMDDIARAAVTGLSGRLAEIESRLAILVDGKQDQGQRSFGLKETTEIIDAVVRDIDRRAPADREAVAPPRLVGAIPEPAPRPTIPISAAAEQLADIRFELDALLADEEEKGQAAVPSGSLPLADQDHPWTAIPSLPAVAASDPTLVVAEQLRRLESQMGEIVSRLPERKDAELASAIREISLRQQAIDQHAETNAMLREQRALTDIVSAVRADVASLAAKMGALARGNTADPTGMLELVRRIDALNADRPLDGRLLDSIRADLDQLKRAHRNNPSGAALADLDRRYDDIARRIDALLEAAPEADRLDALAQQMSELQRMLAANPAARAGRTVESLHDTAGISDIAAKPVGAAEAGDLARLEQRFDALASSVATALSRPSPQWDAREVMARLDAIAATMAQLLQSAPRAAQASSSPTVVALESRLGQMAANINGLLDREATGDPAPAIERIEARLDRIAESVDSLFMGMPPSETNAVLRHIDQRLDRALGNPSTADGGNATSIARLEALHQRLQRIAERIEAVKLPEMTIQADLDDIRTEVFSIRAVHQRLQTLTERIDSIAAIHTQPLFAATEIKEGMGAIRAMHDRVQTITDRIDAMSAAQREALPTERLKAGLAAMRAIQEQVAALAGNEAGVVGGASRAKAIAEIRSAVAAIGKVHDELRALAERASALADQSGAGLALDDIKRDIAALRTELAAHRGVHVEPLERLVSDLANQVATVSRAQPDSAEMADLANRVSVLAGELEQAKPRVARLEEVEMRMARLQEAFSDTRKEAVEAARGEARAVVHDLSRMVARGEIDASVVGALVADLKAIKGGAEQTGGAAGSLPEAPKKSLGQMVSRPSQLGGDASAGAKTDTVKARAIEMGAGDDAATNAGTLSEGEQRSDFIAAARRAAKASAEQVARPVGEMGAQHENGATSNLLRFSRLILRRKRTLLLATAAVMLAVGALQMFAGRINAASDSNTARVAAAEPTPQTAAASETTRRSPSSASTVATSAASGASLAATAPLLVAPAAVAGDSTFAAPVYATEPASGTLTPSDGPIEPTPAPRSAMPALAAAGTGQFILASQSTGSIPVSYPLLDYAIGSQKLASAALNGNPSAEFEVAARYAAGSVVLHNPTKAAEWYQRAAKDGVAVAAFRLASLYERGDGVSKDLPAALAWYQRAADQGNVNAMHNLAVLLSNGVNGAPDPDAAVTWFTSAANYGVRDSQYNLGVVYARGLGTPIDLREAYKWFAIAAAGGDKDAAARRDEIGMGLPADELAQAKAAVAAWHAKQPSPEANAVSVPSGGWDGALTNADRQELVKTIQTLLADQGYDPGPQDGRIGPKTTRAIRDYQQKAGFPMTGQPDAMLLASLSATH